MLKLEISHHKNGAENMDKSKLRFIGGAYFLDVFFNLRSAT